MTVTTRNSIIIVAISVIMALICTTTYRLWKYKETVKSLTVQEPKLTDIADGEYEGEYDLSLVYAKVKVTINKGRIENIAILKHDNGRGKKAEKIIEDVIGQQKLGVNAITGATASSKAILKAIENALQDAETSD
jgi:uncharacterized protein with FMN-binding domain